MHRSFKNQLTLAQAYVAKHPAIKTWLAETGLGSDLTVLNRVVEIARAAALRGTKPQKPQALSTQELNRRKAVAMRRQADLLDGGK